MNIKNILKLSALAISASFVNGNECDELKAYIDTTSSVGTIDLCKVNSEGHIIEL